MQYNEYNTYSKYITYNTYNTERELPCATCNEMQYSTGQYMVQYMVHYNAECR